MRQVRSYDCSISPGAITRLAAAADTEPLCADWRRLGGPAVGVGAGVVFVGDQCGHQRSPNLSRAKVHKTDRQSVEYADNDEDRHPPTPLDRAARAGARRAPRAALRASRAWADRAVPGGRASLC